MIRIKVFFIIVCIGFFGLAPPFGLGDAAAQSAEKVAAETVSETKAAPVPELQDIVPLAASLGKRLEKLNAQLAKLETTEQIEADLVPIFEVLETLVERLEQIRNTASTDFGQLRGFKSDIQLEENRIKRILTQITEGIGTIEDAIDEWRLEEQKWANWREALSQNNLYGYVKPTFISVEEMFRDAQRAIENRLKPILAVQQKAWQAQNRILDLKQRVDSMIVAIRGEALGTATPILFSRHFWDQLRTGLFEELVKGGQAIRLPRAQYFAQKGWILMLQVVIILTISLLLSRRPDILERSDRLKWFVNRPVATGCLVGVGLTGDFLISTAVLLLCISLVLTLAAARLLGSMVRDSWLRWSLYGLLGIHLLVDVFDVINLPAPLMRLFVAVITLAGVIYFGRRALAAGQNVRPHIWFLRLWVAILAFSLVAEVFGFSRLAAYILFSSVATIFMLVLAWMIVQFLQGVIEILVYSRRLQKFALIRNNAREIIAKTDLLCWFVIGLWLVLVVLRTWKIYADITTALMDILSIGLTVGDQHFSLGLMLAAGLVLYGAFLFSWSIQSLLLDGVIMSRKMEQGVRISMARLVHYAIVLVGVMLTLSVLGFNFTNIAIIGGALGVGIGFGMQTIVNNFVCGLIMLFERPVKVGDSVEFGDQQGRVKQVGLRATVVATYDNAEIVVPNADLITSQVTNWTLAERRRRLKLPVGVAYGSDVSLVMQTLLECAEDHVMVLSNPKPAVIFFGFGASSLDFELRVWIADFDSRRQVQSEINQDIDQRFRDLGIEIPFPQQDLHLRSADPSVSGVMAAHVSE